VADTAKRDQAMDVAIPSPTLRQRISARVAKTGRRLLGLEADRTLLEGKLVSLERQVGELLLHGRRTAHVESRIDQTHRQLVALDARVSDVQDTAKSVPEIAHSTHQLLANLSETRQAVGASIAHAASNLSADVNSAHHHLSGQLDGAEVSLKSDLADLAAAAQSLHIHAQAAHRDTQTAQERLLTHITGLSHDIGAVGSTACDLQSSVGAVSGQITSHQAITAQTQTDVQAVASQITSHQAISAQTQTDVQAIGAQLARFEANTLAETGLQTQALTTALDVLSNSLFTQIGKVDADLRADQAVKFERERARDGSLGLAQEKLDLLQARSQSLTEALAHVGAALTTMDGAHLNLTAQQSALLENLMGEAFRRLDHQAANIDHSHQILLQQPIYTGPGINAVVRVGGWDGHPIAVPSVHAGVVHGHYINGAASGEPGVRAAIRALVKQGMCAIDVGAHVGVHSVIIGYHVGETGRLICFEPDPELAAALSQTMLMNGYAHKAQIINAALADAPARMAFFRTPHSPESTLFPTGTMPERDTIQVDVTSLDSALPTGTRVDFLKIDAEGAEARIYRGMKRVLSENAAITMIVEFAPEHFVRAGENPKTYLETAVKDGFSLATIDEPTGAIEPTNITKALKLRTCNLLLQRN
jgi:FkbM family methyltransferase